MSDHPITALEAVMEAGGFDNTKANLKGVRIIRHEGSSTRNYIVNLKRVVDGKSSESFYLKPGDIVCAGEDSSGSEIRGAVCFGDRTLVAESD
jgi:protein involved in polysaccharide export with SLBB domain